MAQVLKMSSLSLKQDVSTVKHYYFKDKEARWVADSNCSSRSKNAAPHPDSKLLLQPQLRLPPPPRGFPSQEAACSCPEF